ncbi:MAG: hypothetical protein DM484_01680, partial [Candidatus Methylumidiphilus alinenensis]
MDTQYNEFRFRLHPIVLGLQLVLAGAAMAGPAPTALPTGGQVVSGQATISQPGAAQLQINQATQQATLNWQTFNIGSAAQVNFQQPNASSVALNRVLQSDASVIEGKLTANGQVFLVNPGGVIFGKTAQVDVGGLVATTMKLSDKDFANRNYHFTRDGSTASVVNNGQITAANGGYVALVAATVVNNGTITANHGTVAMAAGDGVTLQFNGGNLVNIQVDPATVKTLIQNNQLIQAPDGQVLMTAAAASALQGAVINNSGTVEANSITTTGGVIRLTGANEIDNSGTLDASGKTTGGTVQLAAASTINQSGTIDASGAAVGGSVTLAANSPLPSGGGGIINQSGIVRASSSKGSGGNVTLTASNGIANSGTTDASGATAGGSVAIQAGDAISQSGTVTADSSSGNGGSVTLTATSGIDNSGTIDASGATAGGNVTVALTPATNQTTPQADPVVAADPVLNAAPGPLVHQGGTIHADSLYGAGGQVVLAGEYLQLDNGSVTTVTGATGGGAIYAGGGQHGAQIPLGVGLQLNSPLPLAGEGPGERVANATYTRVEQGATLDASATNNGNGGTIVAWGDSANRSYGQFSASGGPNGGNGGTVETSGKWLDVTGAKVNASAAQGQGGEWLLDPYNVTISTATTSGGSPIPITGGGTWVPSASGSNVYNTDINTALNAGNNVTITTTNSGGTTEKGDIYVNADVIWFTNSTLSLQAQNNIQFNANITATGTNPGLTLSYGINSGNNYSLNNQLSNPNVPATINLTSGTTLQIGPSGSTVSYTVINSPAELQGMQNNLGFNYALGSNISNVGSFTPVGNNISQFTGDLEGFNHVISGLTINLPTTDYVGLFGYATGNISNVGLTGGSVIGQNFVGGLAGVSTGTINNAYNTSPVNSNSNYVGGLVGDNFGTLSSSYNTGAVTGGNSGSYIGGLVGYNEGSGTINNNSYSTGAVSGNAYVGGLVGENTGILNNTYSTGKVSAIGTTPLYLGGLIGYNLNNVSNSYSISNVCGNGTCLPEDAPTANYVGGLIGDSEGGHIVQSFSTGDIWGNVYVGGFEGRNHFTSITNAYSLGSVNGYLFVGGLVGSSTNSITSSYSTGSVSGNTVIGTNSSYIGGLVGNLTSNGVISSSYSMGAVKGTTDVGGLIGWISNPGGMVHDSYSTGYVSGTTNVGGLVGLVSAGANAIYYSYWDTDTSGKSVGIGAGSVNLSTGPVQGLSHSQMMNTGSFQNPSDPNGFKDPSGYYNWSPATWGFGSPLNNTPTNYYPYLLWRFPASDGLPQVVSGVLSASGGSAGQTILAAQQGQLLNQLQVTYRDQQAASTGAVCTPATCSPGAPSGFYYFVLNNPTAGAGGIPSNKALLVWQSGAATPAGAVRQSDGGNLLNVNLTTGILDVSNNSTTSTPVSSNAMTTAVRGSYNSTTDKSGGLTQADIPYSASYSNSGGSADISLVSTVAFQTTLNSPGVFILGGKLTTQGTSQTWNNPINLVANSLLVSVSGSITLNKTVSGSAYDFGLSTSASFSQGLGTGIADQSFNVNGLQLIGGGNYTINNSGNLIATLAGKTGYLSLTDTENLTIDTLNAVDGNGGAVGLTAGGNVTLTTTVGGIAVNQLLDVGANTVSLNSGGFISQTATGLINTTGKLTGSSAGATNLGSANNTVANLGAFNVASGTFTLNDTTGGLNVTGAVTTNGTGLASITTTGGNLVVDGTAPNAGSVAGLGVSLTTTNTVGTGHLITLD